MSIDYKAKLAETTTQATAFSWLAKASAMRVARGGGMAESIELLDAPEAVKSVLKSAVAAGSYSGQPELSGASGAAIAFIQATASQSVLMRLVADRAVHRAPLRTRLVAAGTEPFAAVVEPGEAIPLRSLDLDSKIINPVSIATMLAFSEDIWRDASAAGQAFVTGLMRQAVAKAADVAFFDHLTTSPTASEAANVGDDAGILAGLRAVLDAVHTRGGAQLYWAASPLAANALEVMDSDKIDPLGGQILGRPAIVTEGLGTGRKVALINGSAVVAEVERIAVDSTDAATLEMDNAPSMDSTTPTGAELVSLFQTNSVAVKVILDCGFEKVREDAVGFLELSEAS